MSLRNRRLVVVFATLTGLDLIGRAVGYTFYRSMSDLPVGLLFAFAASIQVIVPAMILRRQPWRRLRGDLVLIGFMVLALSELASTGAFLAAYTGARGAGSAAASLGWLIGLGSAVAAARAAGAVLIAIGLGQVTRGQGRDDRAASIAAALLAVVVLVLVAIEVRLIDRIGVLEALMTSPTTSPVAVIAWAVVAWLTVRGRDDRRPDPFLPLAAGAAILVLAELGTALLLTNVLATPSSDSLGVYLLLTPVLGAGSLVAWALILAAADRGLPAPRRHDPPPPPPPPPASPTMESP